ncbi:MAG TPA: glycosyltransferase family 2 protein [Candidatus Moranbacteria bacterium]|nr:glycosyltransferase family 2 protein [Candidatus Moranbacteria bacterium]
MPKSELSIIVTSYRNPQLLRLCLDSVIENAEGLEYELIVCDSATEEETEMMMREDYPGVKFVAHKENVGFQALLRAGIEKSSAPYLLLLNGDIIVTKGSIQGLLSFAKSDQMIGMVGPRLLNFDGSTQDSCFRFYKPLTIVYRRTFLGKMPFARKHLDWFLLRDYDRQEPRGVDWLMGSALLVRRSALERVGLMDKRFFMYMEDVDWCRRFWENGLQVIYYPGVAMHHYHGKVSDKGSVFKSLLTSKLTWVHIVSALKYFAKYLGKPNPHKD